MGVWAGEPYIMHGAAVRTIDTAARCGNTHGFSVFDARAHVLIPVLSHFIGKTSIRCKSALWTPKSDLPPDNNSLPFSVSSHLSMVTNWKRTTTKKQRKENCELWVIGWSCALGNYYKPILKLFIVNVFTILCTVEGKIKSAKLCMYSAHCR